MESRRILSTGLILGCGFIAIGCGDRAALLNEANHTETVGTIPPRIQAELQPDTYPHVPNELLIEVAVGSDLDDIHAIYGTSTLYEFPEGGFVRVATPPGDVLTLATSMVGAGDCAIAEPNYISDTAESEQGTVAFYEGDHVFSDVEDQDALSRIRAPEAHAFATGAGITVAILDTGIDGTHPDLAAFVLPGYDFIDEDTDAIDEANGLDDDGDGLVDEAAGHGTHVAGLVHAVAPGATLLPVRVLDSDGLGDAATVARGVWYAINQGVDVINLSMGMDVTSKPMRRPIREAVDRGIVVVAAAGNRDIEDDHHFPAKLSDVMSIAATDANDDKASFSSYSEDVAVTAPGEGILSTYLDHAYAVWSGTSMSTPLVAGAAALRLEVSPGEGVEEAIEDAALFIDYSGRYYEGLMGSGRLDLLPLVSP